MSKNFKCIQTNADYINQWEKSQLKTDVRGIKYVYLTSGGTDKVYCCSVNSKVEYDFFTVPCELVESDWDIIITYYKDNYTKYTDSIKVISRNKPDNFHYYIDEDEIKYTTAEDDLINMQSPVLGKAVQCSGMTVTYAHLPNFVKTDGFEMGAYQQVHSVPQANQNFYKNILGFSKIFARKRKWFINGTSLHIAIKGGFVDFDEIIYEPYMLDNGYQGVEPLGNSENWRVKAGDNELIVVVDLATLPEPYKSNIKEVGIVLHSDYEYLAYVSVESVSVSKLNPIVLPTSAVLTADIDKTLTADTQPADAKTVGDRLKALEDRIAALEK